MTDAEGGFASPNWPRNYAHHEHCVWNITVHQYKVQKHKLLSFQNHCCEANCCFQTGPIHQVLQLSLLHFICSSWVRSICSERRFAAAACSTALQVIKFRFTHLDLGLQGGSACRDQEDRVQIDWTDNWTDDARTVCVQANTKEIHVTSNTALVSFVTNSQIDAQGFRVFYSEGNVFIRVTLHANTKVHHKQPLRSPWF